MLHYHGTPITPRAELLTLAGRNFCVSFAQPQDIRACHEIGQSVMLDNGAYSYWRDPAKPPIDWKAWAAWVTPWLDYGTTWCVLPDSIDGDEAENDQLLHNAAGIEGVPVWHLHESLSRLERLVDHYERVCFGSSGEYATVGTSKWHRRVSAAFDTLANGFGQVPWVHMLRGMSLSGSHYPFASVDSTDVARNHARPQNTALRMVTRWDGLQNPPRWQYGGHEQLSVIA